MKLGAKSWNFRGDLRSGALSIEGLLRVAVELGLDGVELLVAQFPEFTQGAADRFRRTAAHLGVDIAAYSLENDFAHHVAEVRRAEVETVCHWIRLAGTSGVPFVKVFTGDRDPRVSAETQREWVKDCLAACAEAAEAHGVTVAVENHSSICFTPAELLTLVEEIGSPACKVCLDAYNCAKFTGGEAVYEAAEALAGVTPYTYLQFYQIDPDGRELHVDMPRLLKIYRDAGYDGYLVVKWHGSEDPYRAVAAITRYLRGLLAAPRG